MIRKNHILTISALFFLIGLSDCNDDTEDIKIGIESKIDKIIESNINITTDAGLTLLIQNEGKTELRKA